MEFMYNNIKKYLDKNWLERQHSKAIEELSSYGYVSEEEAKLVVSQSFNKIDELIGKIENVEGFSRWVNEIKTAKQKYIHDLMFELFCFENLLTSSNKLILKVQNSAGGNVEAMLKTKWKDLYIDMINIRKISTTPKKKVHDIFKKSKEKFTDRDGILFVGCANFQKPFEPSSPDMILEEPISALMNEITKKFQHRKNERTEGIVLVVITWVYNPTLKKIFFDKRFLSLMKPENRGGPSQNLLRSIFKVNQFLIQDTLLSKSQNEK